MNTPLQKGIFWIKNIDDIAASSLCFSVACTADGTITGEPCCAFLSKSGTDYNHKKVWEALPPHVTDHAPFDYYPRGRVEIKSGVATVWCSPWLFGESLQNWCVEQFGLTAPNGIRKVILRADYAAHYRCFLDG